MSENTKNSGITVGGVSGNKKLRLGRVHKKVDQAKPDEAASEVKEAPAAESAPEETPAAASAEAASAAEKPARKSTAKKTAAAKEEAASETKDTKAAKETKTTKTTKTKKADDEAPAAEAEEKPKAAKTKTTKKKAEEAAQTEEPKAEENKAQEPETAKTDVKAAETTAKAEEAKKEEAPKAQEPKPSEPSGLQEVKKQEPPKVRISSAVVAMPDKAEKIIKKSSYTPKDNPRDRRPYGGGAGTGRPGYGGGAGRPGRSDGGAPYGKDDEDSPSRPMARKPARSKSDEPIEEVKKSRANFADRAAQEKKRNNNDDRREGGKGDKRKGGQSQGGRYTGRMDGDYDDDYGYRKKKKKSFSQASDTQTSVITEVQLPPFITVKEFAEGIGKKSSDVIMELMKLGVMANINQELDFDTAFMLADAFGISATPITEVNEEEILFDEGEENEEGLKPRPPVVVVMGHVDHGKTSLLDKIRSASVVSGEAGGITQHIGAYTVRTKGRQITFLDTPGHEAFTTMRARGAQFTDIAILVVAADDGVMPQTIEAINHAKAAGTEIIVAINKMDKPGANPDKVKQELSNYELIPEEWGGSTIMVPISAKQGTGIDDLLDMVLLTADVMELKADPTRQAKGAVIEAQLDKNRGPVATILVQRGTLRQGDTIVCGAMIGNVRAMYDDKGNQIKKAGPSIPVEILGLPEVPEAGETLYAVTDDKMARSLVEKRKIKQREEHIRKSSKMSLDTLAAQMAAGDVKDLNLIIKADVQGSVEAVKQSMEKLSNDEVKIKVIHDAVGAINESDISLADISNAIIIGFNVRPNQMILDKAKEAGVDIRLYSVIYNAIEDVENAMKGLLAPTEVEVVLGHVEVRELFKVSGVGTIGGCYVLDGKIVRNCGVRVVRDDVVVYTGNLGSLQRMKDAVKEVNAGYECGLSIERFNDIKIGDIIESFEIREVARE
ncbi:translation initiation factor IF-2 [Ruminococcaceae bacterium YRB3002]|nr:translation initiation factor IF-2 [Ruminococcaceae bacterium YRB3002]